MSDLVEKMHALQRVLETRADRRRHRRDHAVSDLVEKMHALQRVLETRAAVILAERDFTRAVIHAQDLGVPASEIERARMMIDDASNR